MASRLSDPFWNHNTHYHPDVLRLVTGQTRSALDVGCGEGLLTRRMLAAGVQTAVGVDVDAEQIERARARSAGRAGAEYVLGDVLDVDLGHTFDLVTCYATIHHIGLRAGLERLAELTAPGGSLVILGLARGSSAPVDVLSNAVRLPLAGLVDCRREQWQHGSPVIDPEESHQDVVDTARSLTPGARIRRRLLWRYSLVWQKPEAAH